MENYSSNILYSKGRVDTRAQSFFYDLWGLIGCMLLL